MYPRDVVRTHLRTACTAQILLCRGTLESMSAFDKLEFDRRTIMLGTTPRACPPWCSGPLASAAGAGKQIRVATKVEIPQRVAVATSYPD
jgi:hypothetical protein